MSGRSTTHRWVEQVSGGQRCLSLLLVSEYQVHPLVQMARDITTLQSLSVLEDKHPSTAEGPGGEDHVTYVLTCLTLSKVKFCIR